MNNDLISRQAAIDALTGIEFCHCMEFGEYIGENTREVRWIRAEKAQDALQNLPPVQPEIIRCKDCLMHGVCRFEQGLGLDGYCSQAERRTDG